MEDLIIRHRIFINKRENGIPQPNGTFSGQNASDFYINIPLNLSYIKYDEYINIEKDKTVINLERHNFNPYFIELGFFQGIKATSSSGQTSVNSYTQTETIYEKAKIYNITINK